MTDRADETLKYLTAFTLAKGAGPATFKKLIEHFGDIRRVFEADPGEIRNIKRISKEFAEGFRDKELFKKAEKEIHKAKDAGIEIISFLDERYPAELKEIYDPPVLLYVKGGLPEENMTKVAVVGSRQPSLYGERSAKTISRDLAENGVVVVSGMARGIDSAAHEGALSSEEGLTLAVLGSGLLKLYPPENKKLAERIAKRGAVISEYPLNELPKPENFPVRNRIISGLSQAVLVVEAKEKSGALITADSALEQGRDVFAVPGNIDSARSGGTNRLLKQGAQLAVSAEDILQALGFNSKKSLKSSAKLKAKSMNGTEGKIYSLVLEEPVHVDELIEQSSLPASEVVSVLLGLEIRGLVRQLPGKYFVTK